LEPQHSKEVYPAVIALGITFEELNKLINTSLEELFKTDPSLSNEKLETLKSYFPEMEKALKRKGITREYLWQKYISEHSDGYRVRMFKEHYNRWRKGVRLVGFFIDTAPHTRVK
jgi:hypothetical protein